MTSGVKSSWRSTASALCVLAAIGITFGFLYVMEYLTLSGKNTCTQTQGQRETFKCLAKLAEDLTTSVTDVNRVREPINETQQTQICRSWSNYFDCNRDIREKCGKIYNSEFRFTNISSRISFCSFNTTEIGVTL
uniref:uncharacterized protein LOC120328848 n=1 Tax=Styela clava TaxID=7725 RepID=UPI00193997E3|nr:uncharacterized protein LOC120328848 [Styela clava]